MYSLGYFEKRGVFFKKRLIYMYSRSSLVRTPVSPETKQTGILPLPRLSIINGTQIYVHDSLIQTNLYSVLSGSTRFRCTRNRRGGIVSNSSRNVSPWLCNDSLPWLDTPPTPFSGREAMGSRPVFALQL